MVKTRGGGKGGGGVKLESQQKIRWAVVAVVGLQVVGASWATGMEAEEEVGTLRAWRVVYQPGTSRQRVLRGKNPRSQHPAGDQIMEEQVRDEEVREEEVQVEPVNLFINDKAEERYLIFGKRRLCKTKVFHPDSLIEMRFDCLMKYFKPSHLDKLLTLAKPAYLEECIQFYSNLGVDKSKQEITTRVRGVDFVVFKWTVNEVLGCPWVSSEMTKRMPDGGPYEFKFQNIFPAYKPGTRWTG